MVSEGRRAPVARTSLVAVAVVLVAVCVWVSAPAFAAGDANSAVGCAVAESSPGFESFMPDCRAYELVTPPYGGGQPPKGIGNSVPPISANGEHLLSVSFGGFAETGNLENSALEYGAIYEFSRTAAGWSTEALDPPASVYPRRVFLFASADLSRTLWLVANEEIVSIPQGYDGWQLVIREATGGGKGRFTPVGPVVAPGHGETNSDEAVQVVGASPDLTHIFLSVRSAAGALWPGDETVEEARSVYEYRGISGEPVLVGVANDGPLTGVPVNGHAHLVSRCGTGYDAVSTSGGTVYFTANSCAGAPLVSEVDARIDGERTVAISEPSTADCAACDTSKAAQEAAPEGATFQGASQDGSNVLFTTKQQLFDGADGENEENLYMYNAEAPEGERVELLAPEAIGAATISEDGSHVYFQSKGVRTEVANGNGETAESGHENLYVYDTRAGHAHTSFVGQEAGAGDRSTRDGEFVVFESPRQFAGTNDDPGTVTQLFEYDASTGKIARVSVGQHSPGITYECPATKALEEGFNCDGNTTDSEDTPKTVEATERSFFGKPTEPTSHLTVSEDGAVVFTSALALTPQASGINVSSENVYEYRAGNVYLISPGDEAAPVGAVGQTRLLGIDETGRDVFFRTTDSLVPQDTDTQLSWYDARAEGGFPAPVSPAGCVAEGCQAPLGAAPLLPSAGGSAVTAGGSNLSPPAPVPGPLSRAQRLAKALAACRRGARGKRHACEVTARSRYGSKVRPRKAKKKAGK